jgi:hypothetical protein
MKTLKTFALVFSFVTIFSSCSDDDNKSTPVIEEELITTITAIYTPQGGGTVVTLKLKDLDGDGAGAPDVTVSGPFAQNTTYNGVVTFTNESVNPAEDVTIEIIELADEHQVFYQNTGTLNNFTYATAADNFDSNGKPVGLQSVFTTTGAATGSLKITLIHLPNKTATGVTAGDITNAGGSTDAEAVFSITVE